MSQTPLPSVGPESSGAPGQGQGAPPGAVDQSPSFGPWPTLGPAGPAVLKAKKLARTPSATGLVLIRRGRGCCDLPALVNALNGNLLLGLKTAAGGRTQPPQIFTYNSSSTSPSDFGIGWTNMHDQWVDEVTDDVADVHKGDGAVRRYKGYNPESSPYYTQPPAGARNRLERTTVSGGLGWIEMQPNGFEQHFDSSGQLVTAKNLGGSVWTYSYDPSSRLESITHPAGGGRTTYAYDDNSKIRRIVDPSGRTTTFTVAAGRLVGMTTPELCVTSLAYNANDRLVGWITPEGQRTDFAYDQSERLLSVASPSGERGTISYLADSTRFETPQGQKWTMAFDCAGQRQRHHQSFGGPDHAGVEPSGQDRAGRAGQRHLGHLRLPGALPTARTTSRRWRRPAARRTSTPMTTTATWPGLLCRPGR